MLRGPLRALFLARLDARHDWVAATHQTLWFLGFLVVALVLAGAAWAVRRQSAAALVALAALALLQLSPMVATDRVAELAPPVPWVALLGDNRSVMLVGEHLSKWAPEVPMHGVETVVEGWRDVRLDLDPATGALHGVTYPVASDLDGIYSPLHALLLQNLAAFDWPARIRWLRLLGAGWLVRQDDGLPPPPLERVAAEARLRVRSELYRIPDPAPVAFWPRAVVVAASPIAALGLATNADDPVAIAVASRAVEHRAGGRVELLAAEDDRMRLAVESAGGLLVVQRAYFPLIEARLEDGRRLATQPVDLVLLGVEVPPGRHEIRIGTSQRPEAIAGGIALLVFALRRDRRLAAAVKRFAAFPGLAVILPVVLLLAGFVAPLATGGKTFDPARRPAGALSRPDRARRGTARSSTCRWSTRCAPAARRWREISTPCRSIPITSCCSPVAQMPARRPARARPCGRSTRTSGCTGLSLSPRRSGWDAPSVCRPRPRGWGRRSTPSRVTSRAS